ncbi:MAG: S66 peptidase family protein [Nitrospirota bacterium]
MTALSKPPALRKGDLIGVVAPAGAVKVDDLNSGIKRLEELGYRMLVGRSLRRAARYLAGQDAERAADVMAMFENPEVRAVVAARGGYGTSRIIPLLDAKVIARSPKIFVGSSDLTLLLHFLRTACGFVTFHGPMVSPNFGKYSSPTTSESFVRILGATRPPGPFEVRGVTVLKGGGAEGVLTGGCLSLVCQTIGTPYEIQTDGAIVFLEDINEPPYRIDRMLTYLKQLGKFARARAVIFGLMPDCHPAPHESYTLHDVIRDVLGDLRCPILADFPSGHGGTNVTLPFGVRAAVDGATLSILDAPVS